MASTKHPSPVNNQMSFLPPPVLSVAASSPGSSSATLASHSYGSFLKPITPLQSSRYEPVPEYPQSATRPRMFPPGPPEDWDSDLDRYMHDLGALPPGWEQLTHVDGKPYFRHAAWGVVTESYIRDRQTCADIELWYQRVQNVRLSKKPKMKMSSDLELYLTIKPEPAYYFVDHKRQSVFWLNHLPLEELGLSEDIPALSFKLFVERNYYRHLENFPVHNTLPVGAEKSLRGALTHACTEHMTSRDSSTAPWNAADCKTFIELLDGLEDDPAADSSYRTWYVSRLLCNILNSRYVYHYGMYEACTDRLATVNAPRPYSLLSPVENLVTGVLLFCAPFTYVNRLEALWADGVVSLDGWQKLLSSLLVEWSDSNLLATVTLSANMALLALPTITPLSVSASIASSLFAIGSIVIGLHHVWRHRVKVDTSALQASTYLRNATKTFSSLKILAFFLSLPLILLSWSLILFTFAVTVYGLNGYDGRTYATLVSTGTVLSGMVTVIALSIAFFWGIFSEKRNRGLWWSSVFTSPSP